jgi:hypothetical protein
LTYRWQDEAKKKGRLTEGCRSISFPYQVRQLGDVGGDAPSFIESQCLGDLGITLISVTVDIGESLSVRVH